MPTRKKAAPVINSELRQFTLDFFSFHGATITPSAKRKDATLYVALPDDLAEHFGKAELDVTFHNFEGSAGSDLVAHGSRTFDRMLAFLDRKGALTVQELPRRHTSSEELLQAVRPLNANITKLRMQEEVRRLFVFNWRITYRADDKREELHTLVLNDEGERLPLVGEPNAPADALDVAALLADAQPVAIEPNGDGQTPGLRLPPLAQLVRLAETARKYAIYHADLRCVAHEAEIMPRLYKSLNRLTTYYGQQIQEVYEAHDPTGEKRTALEADLERKVAEEVDNHRLRVQVTLYSYAILQTPVAVAEMVLADGKREAAIRVTRDRYLGTLGRPHCHACGEEASRLALDCNGHVTCDLCIEQCGTCLEIVCAECGVLPCPVCAKQNCAACGQECDACGARACVEHIGGCPVCGDTVCLACQAACSSCGVRQCRSHLRADAVLAADGSLRMICGACAVRCPGCFQYSASLGICASSGQRYCLNCLTHCTHCGRRFGPGFFEVYAVDGKPYCFECMQECPVCHRLTPDVVACSTCGVSYCYVCGLVCDVCQQHCCDDHAYKFDGCSHIVCAEHRAYCGVGGEELCPVCHTTCGICARHYCDDHAATCRQCGCVYCRECVRVSGLCDTCASFGRDSTPVRMETEPCAADPFAAGLIPGYSWVRARNHHYTIYLGHNLGFAGALIVTEQRPGGDHVLTARKLSMKDSLRERLTRVGW